MLNILVNFFFPLNIEYKTTNIGKKIKYGLVYKAKLENRHNKNIGKILKLSSFSILIKYLIERIKNNHPKFSVIPQKADDLKKVKLKTHLNKKREFKLSNLYFSLRICEKKRTFSKDKHVIEAWKLIWLKVNGFKYAFRI